MRQGTKKESEGGMMDLDTSGCGVVGLVVVVVAVVVVAALFVLPALENLNDSEAARVRAETDRIDARTRQQHQQSVDWQHELMVFSVAMKASGLGALPVLVVGVALGFGALAVGFWVGSAK